MSRDVLPSIRCRFCGLRMVEDAGDPAPGVCPPCLDRRMAAATLALADAPGTNVTRTAYRLLREVGLTDPAARAFLAEAADFGRRNGPLRWGG